MSKGHELIPLKTIERRIYVMRDQKVMLDRDLAELYDVTTGRLNEQVKRNLARFPDDFAFQLSQEEFEILISQNAISSSGHGGRRKLPWAFTEHGILMLSSVLRSERAVQVNIAIMRAFVKMREVMLSHKELARRLDEMELKYDSQFKAVFDALRRLMAPPNPKNKHPIGYIINED